MGEREYALPSGVTPFKDAKMQALKRVRWLGLVVGSVLGVVVIHGALADVTPHVYPYVGYSGPHYVGPSGHAVCNTSGYDWSHSENLSFYGYYTKTSSKSRRSASRMPGKILHNPSFGEPLGSSTGMTPIIQSHISNRLGLILLPESCSIRLRILTTTIRPITPMCSRSGDSTLADATNRP